MNQEPTPSAALLDEDPIQVIRNSLSRIRKACSESHTLAGCELPGVAAMKFTIAEELELVEQALQRVQPT